MAGMLVAAQAQDTTTTTGTGVITLANAVPAGAPAGSTTFAAAFAPTAVFPVANIFYTIVDGSGNIEVGVGTLTAATTLTRDFVLFAGVAGATQNPAFVETNSGTHQNYAAGTKNVFSNTNLVAITTPYWLRLPNLAGGSDGGITQDIMSGTFVGSITNGGAGTNVTVRFKLSNDGKVTLSFPAAATNASAGTTVVFTGLPSFLSNIATKVLLAPVISNTATVLGLLTITPGATPTATGTITASQSTGVSPIAFSGTFTTGVANGIAQTEVTYDLF